MNQRSYDKSIMRRLTILIAFVFWAGLFALPADESYAAAASEPVVVVTGDQIIEDGAYTDENISQEKAYTLSELKQLANADPGAAPDNTYVYSARNNYDNLSIYKVQGIRLAALWEASGLSAFAGKYAVRARDGYEITFDPAFGDPNQQHDPSQTPSMVTVSAAERYYYPQIWRAYSDNADNFTDEQKREGAEVVPSVIGWAVGGSKENGNTQYVDPSTLTPSDYDKGEIKLSVGQLTPEDYNNPLWNGPDRGLELIAGEPLSEVFTVDNQVKGNVKGYSRADIMVRGGETKEFFWYDGSSERSMWAKGVSLASLAGSNPFYHNQTIYELICANGLKVQRTKYSVDQSDITLCFEAGQSESTLEPILNEENGTQSFFTAYMSGQAPIEQVIGLRIYNEPPDAPGTPGDFAVKRAGYDSLKLTWRQVEEATGYEIFRGESADGDFALAATVGAVGEYTDKALKTGQDYFYKIRAITTDPKTDLTSCSDYTETMSSRPTLDKPSITKITTAKKAISLKWGKIKGASGYVIYRSMKKSGTYKAIKTIKSGKTVSYKNSKLKKGKKYYYKIRAYRTVSDKRVYSSYSAVKYKKVK